MLNKEIRKNPDSEIFKNNTKVYELKIDKLKVACRDAWKISDKIQKEKYPFLIPLKKITILQKLDIGQLWNITYITSSFKTLNIKVDSETGNILKHGMMDVFKVER